MALNYKVHHKKNNLHMDRRKFSRLISLGSAAIAVVSNMPPVLANAINRYGTTTSFEANNLLNGFINLPYSARPWTYWMWLDGNVSREGITSDLEALKKIGIGGVLIMNLGLPPNEAIQPGPVRFMSPEWRGMVQHAISEADRLGLQINMNNDDGWNSGGPWITPEMAMQKLTWSETHVSGPLNILNKLPQGTTELDTYNDIAVLAFPVRKRKVRLVALSRPVRLWMSGSVLNNSVSDSISATVMSPFGFSRTSRSVDSRSGSGM
jgi:hypothetical protein